MTDEKQDNQSQFLNYFLTGLQTLIVAGLLWVGSTLQSIQTIVVKLQTHSDYQSAEIKEIKSKSETAYYNSIENQKNINLLIGAQSSKK
jgi:hypothetical protein